MTPACQRCTGCSALYFPARFRCHRCGSMSFELQPLHEGRVTGVSRVHRAPEDWPHVHLVELAVDGLRLMAVAENAPAIGATVALWQDGTGAIFIGSEVKEQA